jgi:hypothetical protein
MCCRRAVLQVRHTCYRAHTSDFAERLWSQLIDELGRDRLVHDIRNSLRVFDPSTAYSFSQGYLEARSRGLHDDSQGDSAKVTFSRCVRGQTYTCLRFIAAVEDACIVKNADKYSLAISNAGSSTGGEYLFVKTSFEVLQAMLPQIMAFHRCVEDEMLSEGYSLSEGGSDTT